MRVLISGGGIAGLTLAYWLHQYAIPVVVIEQAQGLRRDGYAIDFLGTGYEVAERMSLIDRLSSQQIPFDDVAYVNKTGKLIARLDAALLRTITDGKYMGLMHWTLEEVLYEALAGQVEVRFGRSLTHVVSDPDAVVVTFTDGTTESFDLLIGADGVHSHTRALVFGPEDQFSRYLGYTIACYPLADRYDIGHAWKMYLEPGRLAAAYCTPQAGEILTFFMYQVAEKEHLPREQRLAHLREVFAGMGWLTQQFLSDVSSSESVFMDAVIQIQMLTWHHGRVALVGDACDCPTLLSGQGASLAMGGAYLLARALHETADYQEAFHRYEQQMYAYVQEQQKSARGFAKSFLPGSPLGLFVQQTMMKVLLRETFRGLLRRQIGAQSILPPQVPQDVRQFQRREQRETLPPKPKGFLRWAFLLPRHLYRWHLGWLLGHHCVMIIHVGRKTGVIRQTVLEAVNYDPKTQACQVVAAYGERTDWYCNLQAHAAVEVQVGSKRYVPQQRLLSSEELLTLLQDYECRHPHGLRLLLRAAGYPYDGSPEGLCAIAQVLRGVAFRPQEGKEA